MSCVSSSSTNTMISLGSVDDEHSSPPPPPPPKYMNERLYFLCVGDSKDFDARTFIQQVLTLNSITSVRSESSSQPPRTVESALENRYWVNFMASIDFESVTEECVSDDALAKIDNFVRLLFWTNRRLGKVRVTHLPYFISSMTVKWKDVLNTCNIDTNMIRASNAREAVEHLRGAGMFVEDIRKAAIDIGFEKLFTLIDTWTYHK